MAGHSKFKNIQHRKASQDKKRSKIFSKLLHDITITIRSGNNNVELNSNLKHAINAAKLHNVPRYLIERTLNKSSEIEEKHEIRYEGFAKYGVGLIVESLTSNKNRSAGMIRAILNKYGRGLATKNSVAFNFQLEGHIYCRYDKNQYSPLEEFLIENNANDIIVKDSEVIDVITDLDVFYNLRYNLQENFDCVVSSQLIWMPISFIGISLDQSHDIEQLIEKLEEIDDVQNVFSNYKIIDGVKK